MARYVAIIPDGNRRWAQRRGVSARAGYDAAADTLAARVRDAARLGVEELGVYVFSTENWARANGEVAGLMEMLCERLAREAPRLHGEGVRIDFLGCREGLPAALVEQMERARALTSGNEGLALYLALNYGGRAEILRAAAACEGPGGAAFARGLDRPEMHDPELIVRTGGERRLSNFLTWQAAYSELVFRDELWPDFDGAAFEASLAELDARERRFGGR